MLVGRPHRQMVLPAEHRHSAPISALPAAVVDMQVTMLCRPHRLVLADLERVRSPLAALEPALLSWSGQRLRQVSAEVPVWGADLRQFQLVVLALAVFSQVAARTADQLGLSLAASVEVVLS
ncbi:MAG: hypothetical protein JZU55_00670 [Afipia sp.]|nr:hypothetical protein [Afipia sp.]